MEVGLQYLYERKELNAKGIVSWCACVRVQQGCTYWWDQCMCTKAPGYRRKEFLVTKHHGLSHHKKGF